MCMCVRLLSKDLNPNSYPSHPTRTYTYKITIILRVHNGTNQVLFFKNGTQLTSFKFKKISIKLNRSDGQIFT